LDDDALTRLLNKLLASEDPEELRSLRLQLNSAIRQRLERLSRQARDLGPDASPEESKERRKSDRKKRSNGDREKP